MADSGWSERRCRAFHLLGARVQCDEELEAMQGAAALGLTAIRHPLLA
jgi:hypothetical protein